MNIIETEIWKDIKGYENYYQVSNYGRIKSKARIRKGKQKQFYLTKEKILCAHVNKKRGYVQILLTKEGKQKLYLCHRLVAETFIPNPNNYSEINHIDGNKQNNYVKNLEWCTHSENIKHAYNKSLIPETKNRPKGLKYKKEVLQ
ncbi:MAG TPA: HNH endonuclease [Candidatus Onthousia faecipullorum]|uniref:HNH endonuclease n=1 Tax=Candidatus Onthousia faecipullorum TaxID=2840887 RepID=A0A9D1KCJ2_9FIRM|nr:HNH endonuclease [Candidatus Onthousia faecipullorum]